MLFWEILICLRKGRIVLLCHLVTRSMLVFTYGKTTRFSPSCWLMNKILFFFNCYSAVAVEYCFPLMLMYEVVMCQLKH